MKITTDGNVAAFERTKWWHARRRVKMNIWVFRNKLAYYNDHSNQHTVKPLVSDAPNFKTQMFLSRLIFVSAQSIIGIKSKMKM